VLPKPRAVGLSKDLPFAQFLHFRRGCPLIIAAPPKQLNAGNGACPVCRRAGPPVRVQKGTTLFRLHRKFVDNNRPRNSSAVWRNRSIPQAGQPLFLVLGPLKQAGSSCVRSSPEKQSAAKTRPHAFSQLKCPVHFLGDRLVRRKVFPARKGEWERWVVVDARLSMQRPQA